MSQFPTTPQASDISISSITPTLASVTHSLKRQARQRGGQRWSMKVGFPSMTRADFAPIWAFALSQKGQYGVFTYIPPIYGDTSGTASGTLSVNNAGGYEAGISSIASDGLTGTLKAGDFIKFTGHDKVYMLTADSSTTLSIEPQLMTAVADNETVTYNDVPFTVAFTGDTQKVDTSTNGFISYEIALVEIV